MGDFKKNTLKPERRANFPIQLRQSIFSVVICYDVEVHENTRVHTATHICDINMLDWKIICCFTNYASY